LSTANLASLSFVVAAVAAGAGYQGSIAARLGETEGVSVRCAVSQPDRIGLVGQRLTKGSVIATMTSAGRPERAGLERFEFTGVAMRVVPVKIVLYASDEATAECAAQAAFARLDELNAVLSDYDPASELRRLCDTSGEGVRVPVSGELWHVLTHAQALAKRTDGAFDVTVGPVVRLWRRARRRERMPSPERLEAARQVVGYRLIRLHPERQEVELLKPDMRLDLGGIAKGYAVDEALATVRKHGIDVALVDAGGDIRLGTPPPGRPGWLIGVAGLDPDGPPSRFLWLADRAIATSGDTRQYVVIDGTRYSHLVDPRTGLGLTDHSVVTVIARDGITADGLASAVSVLGPERGLKLTEETPHTAAFILRASGDEAGTAETYESSYWKEFPVARPKPNGRNARQPAGESNSNTERESR
jgi:thiamine biosynthesis lipoprotein